MLTIANNQLARLVFGIIIAGTIASPNINGYSFNALWTIFGSLFLAAVLFSIFVKSYQFTSKTAWILWVISAGFVVLCTYLYFQADM